MGNDPAKEKKPLHGSGHHGKDALPHTKFAPDQLAVLELAFEKMKSAENVTYIQFDEFESYLNLPRELGSFVSRLFRAFVPPDQVNAALPAAVLRVAHQELKKSSSGSKLTKSSSGSKLTKSGHHHHEPEPEPAADHAPPATHTKHHDKKEEHHEKKEHHVHAHHKRAPSELDDDDDSDSHDLEDQEKGVKSTKKHTEFHSEWTKGFFTYANFLTTLEKLYKPADVAEALNSMARLYAEADDAKVSLMASSTPADSLRVSRESLEQLFRDCTHLLQYCSEWEERHCLPQIQASKPEEFDEVPAKCASNANFASSSAELKETTSGSNLATSPDTKPVELASSPPKTDDSIVPSASTLAAMVEAKPNSDAIAAKKALATSAFAVCIPTHKNPSVNPMNETAPDPSENRKKTPEEEAKIRAAEEIRTTKKILQSMVASALAFGKQRDHITVSSFEDWALDAAPSLTRPLEALLHLRLFQTPIPEELKKQYKPIATLPVAIGMEKSNFWSSGLLWALDLMFDDRRGSWKLIYNSAIHGQTLNRFVHHVVGYDGPTIVFIKEKNGHLFGAYMSQPWQLQPKYIGDNSCFVFAITPKLVVRRPVGPEKNYAYLYSGKSYSNFATGIGFGGTTQAFRLSLDEELAHGIAKSTDTTYEGGPIIPEVAFQPMQIEVWGCGGTAAEVAQARANHTKDKAAEMSRKVNRKKAAGDWASGPDKMIMDWMGKTTGESDAYIDEVRKASKKVNNPQ